MSDARPAPLLTLYQYPGDHEVPSISPPCAKVQLALRRMGLEARVVDLRSPTAVAAVSRTGRVPVLDGPRGRVHESTAILDAVEEMAREGLLGPTRPLSPVDPAARSRDRLWEHFATDTLYWIGYYLRWLVPEHRDRLMHVMFGRRASLGKLAARALLGRRYAARARSHGIGQLGVDEVLRSFERGLDTVEAGLEGGPFLGGQPGPGRGDLAVATLLVQAGWRDAMPAAWALLRHRTALLAHVGRSFEACGFRPPAWARS